MSFGGPKPPRLTAALAGVPTGVQALGPWSGRRQLFVKFAQEAETATMFTADALRSELKRCAERSRYHSVVIAGRDPLAEADFLHAVFGTDRLLPVMLDHDGQRPEALEQLLGELSLVQVTLDGTEEGLFLDRVGATLEISAKRDVPHAVAITPEEAGASDAQLLRIVELAHGASDATAVVLHPPLEKPSQNDRRWTFWLQRAAGIHDDVRLLQRLPAPIGMR
jgi:hypothetical protein